MQRNVEDPNARHTQAGRLIHKEPKTSTKTKRSTNQKLREHRQESKNTRAENTRRNTETQGITQREEEDEEADQGQVDLIRTITREGNKKKTGCNTT